MPDTVSCAGRGVPSDFLSLGRLQALQTRKRLSKSFPLRYPVWHSGEQVMACRRCLFSGITRVQRMQCVVILCSFSRLSGLGWNAGVRSAATAVASASLGAECGRG